MSLKEQAWPTTACRVSAAPEGERRRFHGPGGRWGRGSERFRERVWGVGQEVLPLVKESEHRLHDLPEELAFAIMGQQHPSRHKDVLYVHVCV